MNPLTSGLMRHDGRIAYVGRRFGELERPVCRRLEIVHWHEPAGVLLQHEEARMSVSKVKFAAGRQHGCNFNEALTNLTLAGSTTAAVVASKRAPRAA